MKTLKAILIGAGSRGAAYTNIMSKMPEKFQIVAVAEPIESRREYIREKHNIPENMCFADYNPLFELGKIADVAIISTMDRQHFEPTMKAISLKYDILLEKPISSIPKECQDISTYAEEMGVRIVVCHVLRYTPIFSKIKEILDSGRIGRIISVNHEECVGNVHQSHSFVRGNWGNSERSSCMLLQKSCHDMDLLQWLIGKKCKKIQSYGTLSYFREENAPEGAPDYCIEGCPKADECPYNAVKLYYDDKENMWLRKTSTRHADPTDEMVKHAISTTQFGKCVFKCDNDVVDHQTVNMLFEDDITVNFTMCAFNKGGRFIHIMGTGGELHAADIDDGAYIKLYDFKTLKTETTMIDEQLTNIDAHSGGDTGIVNTLHEYLCGVYTGKSISTIRESADSHLIVFAAEEARKKGVIIDFEEYSNSLKKADKC